jgi:hypothetical protein
MFRCLFLAASAVLTASVPVTVLAQRSGGDAAGAARGVPLPASARSLTVAAGSAATPDANGFIQRWLILEPIPVNGQVTQNAVQTTVKKDYFPDQLTVIPKDGDQVTVGNTNLIWHAMDTKNYNVNLYHFGYMLKKSSANALYWAVTVVNCPEEMHNVRLAIGCNSATVWWVNGQEVIRIYGDRQTVVDDGVSKRITLKKGANVVRCALVNNAGATDFCARFLDSDEKPITGITISTSDAAK